MRVRDVVVAAGWIGVLGDHLVSVSLVDPAKVVQAKLNLEPPQVNTIQFDAIGGQREGVSGPVELDRLIEFLLRLGQFGGHIGEFRRRLLATIQGVLYLTKLAGQDSDLAGGLLHLAVHGNRHRPLLGPSEPPLHRPQFVERLTDSADRSHGFHLAMLVELHQPVMHRGGGAEQPDLVARVFSFFGGVHGHPPLEVMGRPPA